MDTIISLILQTTFINNSILVAFFILFAFMISKASDDPKNPIDWSDLLLDGKTRKMSLDKLTQFWGVVISSWMMVFLTQVPAAYTILPMMFPAYLAFVGGVYSFNRWLRAKNESKDGEKKE